MRIERHESVERVQAVWDSFAPRAAVGLESRHLTAIARSGINAIEPHYLVAYEGAEPVGIAYCFLMQMDFAFLQKDLPPDTIRTLRAWHPDFMRSRLLECGFVSGLGEAVAARGEWRPAVCRAAALEMEQIARESRADILLIRDVPAAHQKDYAALGGDGFLPLLGFPIARMAVRWRSFDEYLQALKCTSRKRIRRYLSKRSPDLESEIIPSFSRHADRLAELWANTHRRASDYSHEELNPAYFCEVDRQLGERSHVVAIKRKGEIVAFSLCLLGDEEYFSAHAGLDYERAGDDNLYFCLSMAVLGDALPRGVKSINRGITTYDVKFELGFEADPQLYLVKHVAEPRLTAAIARRLRDAMPQPENKHRPFRDQEAPEQPQPPAPAVSSAAPTRGEPDVFEKVHKNSLYERANDARLARLYGFFPPFESAQGPITKRNGRPVIMLGSNAYLGLSTHPELVAAAKAATLRYGTGCSGSPFLNGTLDIHTDLSRALADFMGKEDALLCSTGYQTNVGVVAALAGEGDVLIMDRLDHASLVDGARLSHAQVERFRHNDLASLERALRQFPDRPKLLIVDSVFSMEGTIADLTAIVGLAKSHGARVMVDEAHAIGVLGPRGRGAAEMLGVLEQVDIVMGTFSKSFASVGGFVAGAAEVIDYLRHATRSHMFSASLPPSCVAATRAALEIIKREPERRARVLANAEYMARRLQELGYEAPYRGTAIVPVHCGQELLAFGLYKKLLDEGVFVNPVASPAVSKGRELLRTSYMATHEQEMLDRAAAVFARVRTDSFPRKLQLRIAPPADAVRVRPMVLLPVADRRSLPRYYVAESAHGLLRVPGFTRLEIGQPVDCGISLGKEGLIVQSEGRVVSKCLIPRPGRALGIDVELVPGKGRARALIESFLLGDDVAFAGRHGWRYHAAIDVDSPTEEAMQGSVLEDISAEGAAIRSRFKPALGARVPLRLKTPDGAALELSGEVRWHREGDDPAFGVHFDLSNSTQRTRMHHLITTITSALADSSAEASLH